MEYVEAVLELVDLIPPGFAVSYGDVADLLGAGGPRQVGTVMGSYGGSVGWWRVLRANGAPPEGHEARALQHYLREATPLRGNPAEFLPSGKACWRVDLRAARWQPLDSDLATIGLSAEHLQRNLPKMSEADGGMTR